MTERLTLIVGDYTISKLRSGEAVEFDNGVTILPASDLATDDALRVRVATLEEVIQTQNGVVVSGTLKLNKARARVAKLEDAGENVIIAFGMGWDMDGVIEVLCAALKDVPPTPGG